MDDGQVESSPGSAVGPGLTLINLTCSPTPACPSLGTGAGVRPASSTPHPLRQASVRGVSLERVSELASKLAWPLVGESTGAF